jgi:hypothetical protein
MFSGCHFQVFCGIFFSVWFDLAVIFAIFPTRHLRAYFYALFRYFCKFRQQKKPPSKGKLARSAGEVFDRDFTQLENA